MNAALIALAEALAKDPAVSSETSAAAEQLLAAALEEADDYARLAENTGF